MQRGERWCDSKCGRGKGKYTAKVEWVGGHWKDITGRKGQVEGVGAALTCTGFLVKTSQSNDVLGGWWRMTA